MLRFWLKSDKRYQKSQKRARAQGATEEFGRGINVGSQNVKDNTPNTTRDLLGLLEHH